MDGARPKGFDGAVAEVVCSVVGLARRAVAVLPENTPDMGLPVVDELGALEWVAAERVVGGGLACGRRLGDVFLVSLPADVEDSLWLN